MTRIQDTRYRMQDERIKNHESMHHESCIFAFKVVAIGETGL